MDVEPQGDTSVPSAHSSVNDVLSNIPSGDSDVIKKIINSGNDGFNNKFSYVIL